MPPDQLEASLQGSVHEHMQYAGKQSQTMLVVEVYAVVCVLRLQLVGVS